MCVRKWYLPFLTRGRKRAQERLHLPAHQLVTESPTRWGSRQKMVARVLEQQKAITEVLSSDKNSRHLIPTWRILTSLSQCMRPYLLSWSSQTPFLGSHMWRSRTWSLCSTFSAPVCWKLMRGTLSSQKSWRQKNNDLSRWEICWPWHRWSL